MGESSLYWNSHQLEGSKRRGKTGEAESEAEAVAEAGQAVSQPPNCRRLIPTWSSLPPSIGRVAREVCLVPGSDAGVGAEEGLDVGSGEDSAALGGRFLGRRLGRRCRRLLGRGGLLLGCSLLNALAVRRLVPRLAHCGRRGMEGRGAGSAFRRDDKGGGPLEVAPLTLGAVAAETLVDSVCLELALALAGPAAAAPLGELQVARVVV